jgi:hypothetical protein
MNRLRRSRKWLSLWLLVAVLGHFGLGHGEVSAFVLCFGANGHVAVEPTGHDHRVQAAFGPEEVPITQKGAYFLKSGESPCIDIPVIGEDHGAHKPLVESKGQTPDAKLFALAVFVIAFIPFDELAAEPVFFPDPPLVGSQLPALRSVVLLI